MPDFGSLKRVSPREIWPGEARDFTPWLAENIAGLGEVLGMDLELVQREAPVGGFSLDLLARDLGRDRIVVIENQIEPTNHDHLGKLLTYAAGYDAEAVVWLASEMREEHRQALDWLNQHTDRDTDFFGVVVEALRIDESRPALNFKLVAFPNEWRKETRRVGATTPRAEAYRAFFQTVIDELREQHRFTGARVGQPQSWYAFSSGLAGIRYSLSFAAGDKVRAEVYIDTGDGDKNKSLFDRLKESRAELESQFGQPLDWERLDERQASRVAVYRPGTIEQEPATLNTIRAWAVERLLKFKSVFGPTLRDLLDAEGQSRSE